MKSSPQVLVRPRTCGGEICVPKWTTCGSRGGLRAIGQEAAGCADGALSPKDKPERRQHPSTGGDGKGRGTEVQQKGAGRQGEEGAPPPLVFPGLLGQRTSEA